MSSALTEQSWDVAPVALLRLDPEARVVAANATALDWLGSHGDALHGRHVTDLLTVGGRIYWETHLAPLLQVEGHLDEVALELRAGPTRLPVLLSARREGADAVLALTSTRDRVRFEQELQAARSAARRSERRLRALQSVTAALSEAVGVDEVAHVLLAASTGALGADQGALWLAGEDGALQRAGVAAADDGEGAPELPHSGGVDVDDRGRSLLPLHGLRGLRGVLVLHPPTAPGADPLDVEVCTAVAQQAGLALDRAQSYDESAAVARQLQAALLEVDPPPDARYGVATFYRPGVAALEVGGDWYDVFLSAPGQLSLVVGDVVGRGLTAASAMGQLRSAVRALAATEIGPGRLLGRLDRFVEQVPAAGMATLAYAEVQLGTGRVRYACAGHPPPLLIGVGSAPSLVWGGRSAPLGAATAPRERPEDELRLAPGDRLLLCTDGLFERRGEDVDEGLRRLVAVTGDVGPLPLPDTVGAVTAALLEDELSHDDVCVLLVEWAGDRFEREISADLVGLSEARRALAGWLGARGVDEPVRSDLVLAASEALANAGEHGAGGRADESVRLHARVRPVDVAVDEVVLEVNDDGHWRQGAPRGDDRGRGLTIIAALVDDVVVHTERGTTVVLRRRLERAS